MRSRWMIGALTFTALGLVLGTGVSPARASSHMDAPLITRDPSANTTDVYAFRARSENGQEYLAVALAVYPFEEPGIGPNNYSFDDHVLYEIHVALGNDVDAGKSTLSYQFRFETHYANVNTFRPAFIGRIEEVFDENQNLQQTYAVTLRDRRIRAHRDHDDDEDWERSVRRGHLTMLGTGRVPPNNQGLFTPYYNQDDDGERPAKGGVDSEARLDRYTRATIAPLTTTGYRAFAGQRDDGFYADVQSVFDDLRFAFRGPNKPFDSQQGFNVHTIVLQIPLDQLGRTTRAGVYATTSRRAVRVLSPRLERPGDRREGRWVQVGRQGNPLFNELFVAVGDKDLYSRTSPSDDKRLFEKYAFTPELATLLGLPEEDRTNRTDIVRIFIPDLIKVALTTGPARLAGAPDDPGFHRLGFFGNDTLLTQEGMVVAGGWPNGRRFGDDVVDIAVLALLRRSEPDPDANIDGVLKNDITYNKVMPYAATPLNGRSHGHHGRVSP